MREAGVGGGIGAEQRDGADADGPLQHSVFPGSSALQACQPRGACTASALPAQFPLRAGGTATVNLGIHEGLAEAGEGRWDHQSMGDRKVTVPGRSHVASIESGAHVCANRHITSQGDTELLFTCCLHIHLFHKPPQPGVQVVQH